MPSVAAALACLVIGVTDGDTLKVRCEADPTPQPLTLRLAEIDAPESRQAFGNRSKQSLAALCLRHPAQVRPLSLDRYGRTVARVECAGQDASAHQVQHGMAWAFMKYLTDPTIKSLEDTARAGRVGLWADAEPVAPWEWRRAQRGENGQVKLLDHRGGISWPRRWCGSPDDAQQLSLAMDLRIEIHLSRRQFAASCNLRLI